TWDYDIQENIRDRYFWLYVQKVSPPEVLQMETAFDMSRALASNSGTAKEAVHSVMNLPLEKVNKTS
ncbi:MAG: hypothetical protein ACRD38_11205, partial [Nitrososphaerales archaeon]